MSLIDIVKTPFGDFAALHTEIFELGVPEGQPRRRVPRVVSINLKGPDLQKRICEHMKSLSSKHPDYEIPEFNASFSGIDVPQGSIRYLLSQEFTDRAYCQQQDKIRETYKAHPNTPLPEPRPISDFQSNLCAELWDQVVLSQAKHFFIAPFLVGGVQYAQNLLKIADGNAGENCGHGSFKVQVYHASVPRAGVPNREGTILYKVTTWELRFAGTLTGSGEYQFESLMK